MFGGKAFQLIYIIMSVAEQNQISLYYSCQISKNFPTEFDITIM